MRNRTKSAAVMLAAVFVLLVAAPAHAWYVGKSCSVASRVTLYVTNWDTSSTQQRYHVTAVGNITYVPWNLYIDGRYATRLPADWYVTYNDHRSHVFRQVWYVYGVQVDCSVNV